MREVPVPTAFAEHPLRRPLMLLAAWLIVLQAFLAGLATAQAAAVAVADPLAVVCHGGEGGANPAEPTDAGKIRHLCCAFCLASAPALAAPEVVLNPRSARYAEPPAILARVTIVFARGVIRAGPSQAPPSAA